MFIAENDNTQEVTDLLSSEQDKILAVAFIGNGLSKVIRGKNKIICNLTSGATNPSEIRTLMKSENIKIRNNSNLHAKVYFTQNKLIVGSSNISTNGIALEKDCANWIEASIITSEKSSLKSSNIWLSELWNTSEEITPKMLNKAEALFKKRRNSRPFKKGSICDLRDRDIYCTIYKNEELSTEANEYANKLLGDNWDENGYGIYESWKKLPKGVLLDFHHSGGKVKFTGIYKFDGYASKSGGVDIQIAKEHKKRGLHIKEITELLNHNLKYLWPKHRDKDEEVIILPINKIVESINNV